MDSQLGFEIEAATLRDWLADGHPVEVIDIRPKTDYDEWHIPGSLNVDAYQALYANSPGPLADYQGPEEGLVVAVCYVGQTSLKAIHYLRRRGIEALSLAGGMQAWSQAWNTAEVPLNGSHVRVIQVRRTGKGCLSYILGAGGEALVIDTSVSPEVYLNLAAGMGWKITRVVDTHIHADHLSRSRLLAEKAGAAHFLPRQDRVKFQFEAVATGDVIEIGQSRLAAIHTPGHTFESMSFLLDDQTLFSGDTLFLDSVGRPDLNADPGETKVRAGALHQSLAQLAGLNPEVLVLPGHTSQPVPFDKAPVAAPLDSVFQHVEALGYDQEQFISWTLDRLPPDPPNYALIIQLNEAGIFPPTDPGMLEAGANHCAL